MPVATGEFFPPVGVYAIRARSCEILWRLVRRQEFLPCLSDDAVHSS
ncbi:unnamed protein product [Callosobruchus maculatus]|uniref:Uncharacterized protein n=1 Tax=Callosobruchus maculatus TaxID=64391 RepID=A0A653DLG9_CALMS|nr:unnamed protein product [Callosobruchus maculatus]